jgi:hypothetical protein
MARCTAPVQGHRTASGAANCPACGRSGRRYGAYHSYPSPPSTLNYPISNSNPSSNNSGGSQKKSKPRWSPSGSPIFYSPAEIRTLTPVRENIEKRLNLPDMRDAFLCHAWDDRKDSAKNLHDSLVSKGVTVWFSEKDVPLGSLLLREIDKGLAKSRVGIVLVTPSFLERVKKEGIAEKELAALLSLELLIPVVHNTSFEDLYKVSPLLASRSGLNTKDSGGTMEDAAAKIAELVAV